MKEMINKYFKEFKIGTKTMFKEFFDKEKNKKQRANMWTFIRLITPILTIICSIFAFITGSIPLLITTSIITGFGALTDKFDGASAKKHNSFSEYGKILDQVTDKCFTGIIGINLLFLNFNYIFVLLGELAIALVNITYKLKYKNLNINSTMIGKAKQLPLFFSLAIGFLSVINPTFMTISNYSILLSLIFQYFTVTSYIKSNNKGVVSLRKKEITDFIEKLNIEEEKNKEKIKTKRYEDKNSNIIENNKEFSKKEQCENLKKLRTELTGEDIVNVIEENSFQKTKK